VVATAIPLGMYKENRALKRFQRLGINPLAGTSDGLEEFQFGTEDLPDSMHWLLRQKWLLTEKELFLLFATVRRQMMDERKGPFAVATRNLCEKYGISYEEMSNHARLLSGKIDYAELMRVSDERYADPTIQQKMRENG
jgi:hypothetical protein